MKQRDSALRAYADERERCAKVAHAVLIQEQGRRARGQPELSGIAAANVIKAGIRQALPLPALDNATPESEGKG